MDRYNVQARLGKINDKIAKKLFNHANKLISTPTECLRMSVKKSVEGDAITQVVSKAEICHVVFPKMESVPLRTLTKEDGTKSYAISSLVSAYADDTQPQLFAIKSAENLNVDDLLCKVYFNNESSIENLNLLILNVTEILGTFGASAIVEKSYKCALYTQELPKELKDMIIEWAQRRLDIKTY